MNSMDLDFYKQAEPYTESEEKRMARSLRDYEKWRANVIFLPMSDLPDIWDKYPSCRIPKNSSWYAIINNEQELFDIMKRVEDYNVFVRNNIIKQVYIKEDPDDNDDEYTIYVDETHTEEQEEFYTVDYNEFFSEDSQLQLTKQVQPKDPYRDIIVLTDATKGDITYPLMLDYYYNSGDDRLGKYTIDLISLKPLTNMSPREGDVKIHFWSFL